MRIVLIMLVLAGALPVQAASRRYALVLGDPPVSERFHSTEELQSPAARDYRLQIERAQQTLRTELQRRHIQVTGATQVLSNCVFVSAPPERESELRRLPGVKSVMPLSRKFHTQ